MRTTSKLVILAIIVLLALSCDLKVKGNALRKPREFEMMFPSDLKANRTVCFSLEVPQNVNKSYVLRLDYLPYVCLIAENDVQMSWNGSSYVAAVQLSRKCKKISLKNNQEELYKNAIPGTNLHQELLNIYAPTLICLFLLSIVLQRFIFGPSDLDKAKRK